MVFFDFDGVLADSFSIYQDVCILAAKKQGMEAKLDKNQFGNLDPLTFENAGLHLGCNPVLFAQAVTDHVLNAEILPPLFSGVPQVLRSLSQSYPLHVLSANYQASLQRILKANGLEAIFAAVHSGDQPGSKTEKLRAVLTGAPAVLIGDATSDMKAAKAVGIHCIGVSWGWQAPSKLRAAGAEEIAMQPEDLPDLIDRLLYE